MLQKTINSHFPQIFLVNRVFSNIRTFTDQYETTLFLNKPKLLYSLHEKFSKNSDIEIPNLVNTSHNIKNEKKSKSNFKILDNIENKKNKLKQKKKIRSKIHLDKDFSDTNEDFQLNLRSSLTFTRPAKNKKINKNKIIENKKSLPNFTDSTVILSSNDVKQVYLNHLLTVQELAEKLHIPSPEIIKWLFFQGISVTINQLLDISIATLVAENYSFTVLKEKTKYNSLSINTHNRINSQPRSPVVTILGHVDHGKTTLLNSIRKNNKFNKEAGDITQGIISYEVFLDTDQGIKKIIFLDTPGHESFVGMRRRGAEITDIVILVVSADDGLKPQTIEAIDHIQKRDLPFIVAINKIDKIEADLTKVKKQLSGFNIIDQNIAITGVSAITGQNIDALLLNLIKLYESQDLKSDPSQSAEGIILEAYLDKQRGAIAKLLIQNGTLTIGDIILSGNSYGKIKSILDYSGCKVDSVPSNALVEILGFSSVPNIGLPFKIVKDEKSAKSQSVNSKLVRSMYNSLNNRIVLDTVGLDGNKCIAKQISFIVKTDVQGSIDPILHAFSKIPQVKVQVNIVSIASGEISLKDIQLASTSNSSILAFNLNISSFISDNAQNSLVLVKQFNIIYDLIDYVKNYMLTFVDVQYKKEFIGHAKVKSIFIINKGVVAGCLVIDGKIKNNAYIGVMKQDKIVYDGILNSLKRGKENVDEVLSGYECGLMCKNYTLWEVGDSIEVYIRLPLEKTL